MNRNFLIFLIILLTSNLTIQAKVLNDSILPGKNFDKAAFRLWIPDNSHILKGLMVLNRGSNGDGREFAEDPFWQELAVKHQFALVGCYFTSIDKSEKDPDDYCNVREGSGQALLDAISHFAKNSDHLELINAPLLFWGHSAGGEFNYEFACWKPDRVIAFVVNKGGVYFTAMASKETRAVPGIFYTGEKDWDSRRYIIKGIFSINRRFGANWAFAEEPGAGHEPKGARQLSKLYFDEIIPLRLRILADSTSQIVPIPEHSGYIGNFKTGEFQSYYEVPECNGSSAWLPTTKFAEAWSAFINQNPK